MQKLNEAGMKIDRDKVQSKFRKMRSNYTRVKENKGKTGINDHTIILSYHYTISFSVIFPGRDSMKFKWFELMESFLIDAKTQASAIDGAESR